MLRCVWGNRLKDEWFSLKAANWSYFRSLPSITGERNDGHLSPELQVCLLGSSKREDK